MRENVVPVSSTPSQYSSASEPPSPLALATFVLAVVGLLTSGVGSLAALATGTVEAIRIRKGLTSPAGGWINRIGLWLAAVTVLFWIVVGMYFVVFFRPLLRQVESMTSQAGQVSASTQAATRHSAAGAPAHLAAHHPAASVHVGPHWHLPLEQSPNL